MHTSSLPPGPPTGFDLGATDETLALMRECFPLYGDLYRVFSKSRGVYDYVINDPEDIKRARSLAAKKGLRYQTYLKMLLHEALKHEERRRVK